MTSGARGALPVVWDDWAPRFDHSPRRQPTHRLVFAVPCLRGAQSKETLSLHGSRSIRQLSPVDQDHQACRSFRHKSVGHSDPILQRRLQYTEPRRRVVRTCADVLSARHGSLANISLEEHAATPNRLRTTVPPTCTICTKNGSSVRSGHPGLTPAPAGQVGHQRRRSSYYSCLFPYKSI